MKKLLVMVVVAVTVMVSTSFGQNAGVVWTEVKNSPFKGDYIRTIVWGNDRFVAVGNNGKIAHSLDGVTWTVVNNSPFDSKYRVDDGVTWIDRKGWPIFRGFNRLGK